MSGQTSEVVQWLADLRLARRDRVRPVRLDRLDGWYAEPGTGDLRHRSGRFFSVEGVEVRTDAREVADWAQPIIVQPESGILGLLVKNFGGVPHFLLQAKMEPGNINTYQLSPTVQATRSNYGRVHRGRSVPYLEHFVAPRRGRVVFDALQSEQGSWFLGKRNRNMIVEVTEDVPVREGFRWLTLERIGELLALANVVNMDTRTVLSGVPGDWPAAGRVVPAAPGQPLHPMAELLSRLTEVRANRLLERRRVPLAEVRGWERSAERVAHESGRYFSVIGVDVAADGREVTHWTQPMLRPAGRGLIAFLVQDFGGTPHLLAGFHTEAGSFDVAELGPTVRCRPENYAHLPPDRQPAFLTEVLSAPPERVLLDVVHSEEGGRFYHAENRYLVVRAEGLPAEVRGAGGDFVWLTPHQLGELLRHPHHVNVEARNLLATLRFAR